MFKRMKCYAVAGFAASLIALAASAQGPATLTINVDKPVAKVSPMLYGLMTEEINYSYEGGLYARAGAGPQLHGQGATTRRTGFRWSRERGRGKLRTDADHRTQRGAAREREDHRDCRPTRRTPVGVRNRGWWGVPLRREHDLYRLGVCEGRCAAMAGHLRVSLIANDSGKVLASYTVACAERGLEAVQLHDEDRRGRSGDGEQPDLWSSFDHPGTVWLQLVSLFPPTYKNTPNGNRVDLMENDGGDASAVPAPARRQLSRRQHASRSASTGRRRSARWWTGPGIRSPWSYRSSRRPGAAGVSGVVRGPEDAAGAGRVCGLLAAAGAREPGHGPGAVRAGRAGRDRVRDRRCHAPSGARSARRTGIRRRSR